MDPLRRVEKIRNGRSVRDRTEPLAPAVEAIQKRVERSAKRAGDFADAWQAVIPERLLAQTRIAGFRAGTAHVVVPSSAVMYELDRLLRGGAEMELRIRMKTTLAAVRLSIGPLIDPAFSGQ